MAKKEQPDYAYLQSVHVKGFRTLKDTEVSFVPGLNIIIGENGVGKSNLLKVIYDYLNYRKDNSNLYSYLSTTIIDSDNTFSFQSNFNPLWNLNKEFDQREHRFESTVLKNIK